jgi:hypothetical protein
MLMSIWELNKQIWLFLDFLTTFWVVKAAKAFVVKHKSHQISRLLWDVSWRLWLIWNLCWIISDLIFSNRRIKYSYTNGCILVPFLVSESYKKVSFWGLERDGNGNYSNNIIESESANLYIQASYKALRRENAWYFSQMILSTHSCICYFSFWSIHAVVMWCKVAVKLCLWKLNT